MTYSEFKDGFYIIRENRIVIRSKLQRLEELNDKYFSKLNHGVTDYSKDRLQSTPDPDRAIIEAIDNIMREKNKLIEEIRSLREENEHFEELLFSVRGISGEITQLYFLDGKSMRTISKTLNYAERTCWRLMRMTLRDLYEKEEKHESFV